MALARYVIVYTLRNPQGIFTEAGVRWVEGEWTKVTVFDDFTGQPVEATRFVPSKHLKLSDLPHIKTKKKKVSTAPMRGDLTIFTQQDMGLLHTDVELEAFLDSVAASDRSRDHYKPGKTPPPATPPAYPPGNGKPPK